MELKILNWLLEGLFFGIGLGAAVLVLIAILVPVIVFSSFVVDARRRRKRWKAQRLKRAEMDKKLSRTPAGGRS
jgi:uncharacterized membrane protein